MGENDFRFGKGSALNLTVPFRSGWVGSDDLEYGQGSGFNLKPVQTSTGSTVDHPRKLPQRAECPDN